MTTEDGFSEPDAQEADAGGTSPDAENPQDAKAVADLPQWAQREIREAREGEKKARHERDRLQLVSEYGTNVMDLVPAELPLERQKEQAELVKTKIPVPADTTPQAGAVPDEPEPDLTGVMTPQASGGAPAVFSDEEIKAAFQAGDVAKGNKMVEDWYRKNRT